MRKNALIFLLVILILGGVVYYFTQDRYLERAVEKTGELIFDAKVEIDNFNFSLLNLQCGWKKLQIANKNKPMTNLIETGVATFKLEFTPLFWGRFIIDEMKLQNVRSGTARKTDGSLPHEPTEAEEEPGVFAETRQAAAEQIRSLPALDFSSLGQKLNIDSLIHLDKLSTVAGYNVLAKDADSTKDYWSNAIKNQDYGRRLNELKKKIEALQFDKNIDLIKAQQLLQQVNAIKKDSDALKAELQDQKTNLTSAMKSIDDAYSDLQNQLKADIERAKKLARLKELDTRDIGLLLFGAPLVEKLESVLHYINLARRYAPAASILFDSEKEPGPERFAGQDIHFPFHHNFPQFLIREIELSGGTGHDSTAGYSLSGTVTGVTNEPAIFGHPTKAELMVEKSAGNSYQLRSVFDHVTETAKDSIWIQASNFKLGKIKLQERAQLPHEIIATKGNARFTGFFVGHAMQLDLKMQASPVKFNYTAAAEGRIASTIREVLDGIKDVDLEAIIKSKQGQQKLQMRSNIDEALSKQLKAILDKNLQKTRDELETRVREEVAKNRQKAEVAIAGFKHDAEQRLQTYEDQLNAEIKKLEEKKAELEAKIASETAKAKEAAEQEKKKLEKQAKDQLKGLFSKPKEEKSQAKKDSL
ncbi:MAG: TIGR03545 family protein [Deferribacteres bacterium]|nr:TIGR03545 family protein [candidate division KSB1 bacterium]MCB9500954.1 TIGR03545 family protein [Deferribacteres bacterium]